MKPILRWRLAGVSDFCGELSLDIRTYSCTYYAIVDVLSTHCGSVKVLWVGYQNARRFDDRAISWVGSAEG
jgi:hypothetical protein